MTEKTQFIREYLKSNVSAYFESNPAHAMDDDADYNYVLGKVYMAAMAGIITRCERDDYTERLETVHAERSCRLF